MLSTILLVVLVITAILMSPLLLVVIPGVAIGAVLTFLTATFVVGITWVIGQTFLGQWIVDGASLLGLTLLPQDLWKVALFLAFVGSFFKSSTNVNQQAKS